MKPLRHSIGAALAAVLALCLTGCDDGQRNPLQGDCERDVHCDVELVCVQGLCVPPEPLGEEVTLSLRIDPTALNPSLSVQEAVGLTARLGASLPPFALASPRVVNGLVSVEGTLPSVGMDATITLRSEECIAPPCTKHTVQSDHQNGFETALIPGRYTATVLVDDRSDIPEQRFSGIVIPAGTAGPVFLSLPVPASADFPIVRGQLSYLDYQSGQREPVVGALISGRASTSRAQTTSAYTDDAGGFTLLAHPGDDAWVLSVRTQASDDNAAVYSAQSAEFTLTADSEATDVDLVIGIWQQAAAIEGNAFRRDGSVLERGFVNAYFVDDAPVAPGQPRMNRVSAEVSVSIDQQGAWNMQLRPGTWDFALTPTVPADALDDAQPAPSFTPGVAVDGGDSAVALSLTAGVETVVSGTVVRSSSDPRPVADAEITFRPLTVDGAPVASFAVPPQLLFRGTSTTADGTFSLPVAPGLWEVLARPAHDSTLPRALTYEYIADNSADVSIELRQAGVLTGVILDPRGEAVTGAIVEAYVEGSFGPVLVDETETDAQGRYRLLLPHM